MVFLFSLVAVFIPLTHGYSANKPYPSFAVCNNDIVSAIKEHWKNVGKPENVLQRIQENGLFTITDTSYDYQNSDKKCFYMNYTDGVITATFLHKNGDADNITHNAQETEDGIIKSRPTHDDAPELRFNMYTIYFDNGVLVWYICGDVEGSKGQEPAVTSILVAKNNTNDLTTSAIKEAQDLINSWGLKFKYNYGSECDVQE